MTLSRRRRFGIAEPPDHARVRYRRTGVAAGWLRPEPTAGALIVLVVTLPLSYWLVDGRN